MGGLHEHRAARAARGAAPAPSPATGAQRTARRSRPAGTAADAHQLFEEDLVEAHGRGRDAGADVGDVERLEHPLDGAVLAEGTVEDGEGDVGPEQPVAGRRAQQLALAAPLARRGRSPPTGPRGRRRAALPGPPVRRTARPRARRSGRRRGPPPAAGSRGGCPLVERHGVGASPGSAWSAWSWSASWSWGS